MKAHAGPYGPVKVHNDPYVLYMNEDFSDRLHVDSNKHLYGDRSEVIPV